MCFLSASLSPCLVSIICCFPSGNFFFCIWCPSLQKISSLHTFWASQRPPAAGLIAEQACLCAWVSVPFLLSLSFSQGSVFFQGCQRKNCNSESSLCFLVWVFILTVPQTVQRCRMQEGYKVSVIFLPGQILVTDFTRFPGRKGWVVASRNEI